MPQTLAQLVKAKYPGKYDDLSDADLEAKIDAKHPGAYADMPRTKAAAPAVPSAKETAAAAERAQALAASSVTGLDPQSAAALLGAAKAVPETVVGLGQLFHKGAEAVGLAKPTPAFDEARAAIVPSQSAEGKIGNAAGNFGLAALAGEATAPAKIAQILAASRAARIAAGSGTNAAISAAQSGGDPTATAVGAVTGALPPVVGGIVSAARNPAVRAALTDTLEQAKRIAPAVEHIPVVGPTANAVMQVAKVPLTLVSRLRHAVARGAVEAASENAAERAASGIKLDPAEALPVAAPRPAAPAAPAAAAPAAATAKFSQDAANDMVQRVTALKAQGLSPGQIASAMRDMYAKDFGGMTLGRAQQMVGMILDHAEKGVTH